MMAVFVALAVVAVERFINRRRLRLYEVLSDVGWLTLIFALIEFAYLFVVEAGTLAYGSAMRPFWYTVWPLFKILMFEAAIGVFLILASVWMESAGIRVEFRRPRLRAAVAARDAPQDRQKLQKRGLPQKRCDIEWREAS